MAGETRFGRFRVAGVLGKGAMGVVYKAIDEVIDRTVAIKTLSLGDGLNESQKEEFKHRFTMEAQFAGKLSHPNIVTVYDVGTEGDISYIAMEYVEGQTLEQIIANTPVDWESLQSIEMIMEVMLQVCEGLHFAHQHGVTHRDIKPANIIVSKSGHAKIMDFGIAKINSSTGTAIGTILGTPGYMAPEQIAGKSAEQRSDIFSLGAVFYECITGKRAFSGNSITEVMYKVMNENPTPVQVLNPLIPPVFDNILTRALRRNPEERYRTVDLIGKDIRKIKQTMLLSRTIHVDGDQIVPKPKIPFLQSLSPRDYQKLTVGLGIYSVLASILLLFSWVGGDSGRSRIAESLSEDRPASLILRLNVPDATIFIDDKPIPALNGEVKLNTVDVGEHKLVAQRAGYEPFETALIFGAGEVKEFTANMRLLPVEIPEGVDTSYITILSDPPMSRVESSAGRFIGYTPVEEFMFPSGKYTLLISNPDHVTVKRDLSLYRNRTGLLSIKLDKLKGFVSLTNVQPESAYLLVNGKRFWRYTKQNVYRVDVGEQQLTIRADGYTDVEKTVRIVFDSTIAFSDTLPPTYGALKIESNPSGAKISLDDETVPRGVSPVVISRLVANAHQIRAEFDREIVRKTVRVKKDDTTAVRVLSSNPNGFLELTTRPAGAEVFLNTVKRSVQTPGRLELKPGFYRIRLSHPQFRKYYETSVRIRPDQTFKITHTFE